MGGGGVVFFVCFSEIVYFEKIKINQQVDCVFLCHGNCCLLILLFIELFCLVKIKIDELFVSNFEKRESEKRKTKSLEVFLTN